jgi:hypothetical protein
VTVTATFDVISAVGINVLTGLIGAMVKGLATEQAVKSTPLLYPPAPPS